MRLLWHLGVALCTSAVLAQQYEGDAITNSLPTVDGAELAYFRINDPNHPDQKLTLLNYYSHGSNNQRLAESQLQRAVIVIHGSLRDGWNYETDTLNALAQQTTNPSCNRDTVAIMAPVFPNEQDANHAYPAGSDGNGTSSAMVWKGEQWSDGGNTQYPVAGTPTSSYTVLDQIVQYYNDESLFPNMKQIVLVGHSRGAQTVVRYAAISQISSRVPLSHYVGNPNGHAWFNTDRPLSTESCATYDNYGDGYSNFAAYPMTYGIELVNSGRPNILNNFRSKNIAFARGLRDKGDASDTCGPSTTGANRSDRFFNFIKAFPPTCSDSKNGPCQTIDYVNAGHDDAAMFSSPAGLARLFLDNFDGDGSRAYDFYYPRRQAGDDPFPDPAQGNR